MKILRSLTAPEQGPFESVSIEADGYLADNTLYPFTVIGECEIVEVADDYVPQWLLDARAEKTKDAFNQAQKLARAHAYQTESDPLFFKTQRGEATQQEWLNKVNEIVTRYPYQE